MTSGKPISDTLRRDILDYYADLERRFATKKDPKAWQKVLSELDKLKALPATGAPEH
jgi:plasmid stabilization system protein ParE